MKLYCAPGFSSLADHIAMLEAGLRFDMVKVDFGTKEIEGGGSYLDVNPIGQVPAMMRTRRSSPGSRTKVQASRRTAISVAIA